MVSLPETATTSGCIVLSVRNTLFWSANSHITKRHMALSFHRLRECIAAKIFSYLHISSSDNPADILSRHWGYNQVWETLKAILSLVHGA
jgi:hypothetical protein